MKRDRSPDYYQVMDLLGRMDDTEKVRIRDHLNSLFGSSLNRSPVPSDKNSVSVEQDGTFIILCILTSFLYNKGVHPISPSFREVERLRASLNKGSSGRCVRLWEFVCKQTDKKLERQELLRLSFECLYDNLRSWATGIGMNSMLNNLDRVPAVLDDQFPGYARSSMLGIVVNGQKSLARE